MKRILSFSIILILFSSIKSLSQIQVIQVKRNIPLSDEEPVFKDYYLSGGTKEGLRVNLVVTVTRWVNLRENNKAQEQSMKMLEPVGWLKVIFAQDHLAVARLYEVPNYLNTPILEQPGILMGDIVSLERSFMSKNNNKPPKDSAQVIEKTSSLTPNLLLSPASASQAPASQAPSLLPAAPLAASSSPAVTSLPTAAPSPLTRPSSPLPASLNQGSAGAGVSQLGTATAGVNKQTQVEGSGTPTGDGSNKLLGEDPQLLKQ